MKKQAIILGINGDIGREVALRLLKDGWQVSGTFRNSVGYWHTADDTEPQVQLVHCDLESQPSVNTAAELLAKPWDLFLCAAGTMEPIGRFEHVSPIGLEWSVKVNALGPLRMLRALLPHRRLGARACFLDGPNLAHPTPSYSAYRAGKAILAALIPTLRAELPDMQFELLHTGVVRTKFHMQTIQAGARAANYDRVVGILEGKEPTTGHDAIYRMVVNG